MTDKICMLVLVDGCKKDEASYTATGAISHGGFPAKRVMELRWRA